MANSVTVMYYGVEGTGRTVTEARKDAGQKIEKLLSGDWNPIIRTETIYEIQYVTIVCRDDKGWNYTIVQPGLVDARHWANGTWETSEEAQIRMRRHLAQYAMHPKLNQWGMHVIQKNDRKGWDDHRSYCRWQFRYMYFRDVMGLNGDVCHNRASESSYDGSFDPNSYPEEIR